MGRDDFLNKLVVSFVKSSFWYDESMSEGVIKDEKRIFFLNIYNIWSYFLVEFIKVILLNI